MLLYRSADFRRAELAAAIEEYEKLTCIRIVPKTSADVDYVHISPIRGCYSYIGKIGGFFIYPSTRHYCGCAFGNLSTPSSSSYARIHEQVVAGTAGVKVRRDTTVVSQRRETPAEIVFRASLTNVLISEPKPKDQFERSGKRRKTQGWGVGARLGQWPISGHGSKIQNSKQINEQTARMRDYMTCCSGRRC
ncbi:Zinc metalloproteinase nas-15 [Toxocara canis]|uniref:Zinc metalloproteinase nas-15 n=1 Tax=Toxocara canis TaxID=6265 RepID=A0A0B2UR39_TOXCA|nr:Zinc metalloproteinase nas-15 [Toxocara canis]